MTFTFKKRKLSGVATRVAVDKERVCLCPSLVISHHPKLLNPKSREMAQNITFLYLASEKLSVILCYWFILA